MKYLITGATGAIGSPIVRQLAAEGKEVRVFVRDAEKFHRLLPDVPAEVVTGDALVPDDVRRAVAGVDVVFHCVNFPLTQYRRTLEAAQVLVEAALPEKPHVVFPGNTWVFGKPARLPITPDTPFNPPSAIACLKAQVDEMLMNSGLPVTVVHLPDFYGPNVVNPLVKPLFENGLAGMGTHRSSWVGKVRGMPFWLLRLLGLFSAEARAGAGMMHTFAWDVSMDGVAIQRDTGFVPQMGYADGIARTLAWFRQ